MSEKPHHVCPWWFAYTFDHPLRRLVQPPEKLLQPFAKSGTHAIDVGCGMGYFSIAMARLGAKVLAVDLQQKMLDVLLKRAAKAGVRDRIETRLAGETSLNLDGAADFALSFWMLHEVPDRDRLLREVHEAMVPGGTLLVVEPKGHVGERMFATETSLAEETGFSVAGAPHVALSRAVLLRK